MNSQDTFDNDVTVDVVGLTVVYDGLPAIEDQSFRLVGGEIVGLVGPSGSGKSTVIRCIAGIQLPDGGSIAVSGTVMNSLSTRERSKLRRQRIGLAFQSPELLPELSVADNVAITLLFDGWKREKALAVAQESLRRVGLTEHGDKAVDEISRGEAQRVAIARALVHPATQLLIADEPTANLDAQSARDITALLVSQVESRGHACLIATHDMSVAAACHRIIDLRAPAA